MPSTLRRRLLMRFLRWSCRYWRRCTFRLERNFRRFR
ncbi:hypothetical protein 2210_scaffold709_00056 [Bacteriophage sp.]|nr:hypothetical protein 2210_scaffold709_00056 [Bacteriophage sp.]